MYADLGRPPLSAAALSRSLVYGGSLWSSIRVVDRTGSTNADLVAAARTGGPGEPGEGTVLVAEHQTRGRGRLDRDWASPPQAGLTFSMLLRPPVAPARWGWLPLLVGVGVCGAVREQGEVDAWLKWPNDLLIGPDRASGVSAQARPSVLAKAGGILAEVAGDAVVVGVGLNVAHRVDELPPGATSLGLAGGSTDRALLLRAVLRGIEGRYRAWCAAGGDAAGSGLLPSYVEQCDSLGRGVSVALPTGEHLVGTAEAVDSHGRLLVRAAGERHALAAGDVTHVRGRPVAEGD